MSETATPRRRRRIALEGDAQAVLSTPAAPGTTAFAKVEHALNPFIEYLRDIERTRQYRLIGRLSRVQIQRPEGAKAIDFRKEGPVLAFAAGTEQLIVTDAWRGIPAKWDDSEEFCKACLSDCDVCEATGTKQCEAYKCGGGGRVPLPAIACPADDCLDGGKLGKRIKANCEMCHSTGSYVGTAECKVCAGTGKATCSQCRGTGERPTGIVGGSTNYREATCPECSGSKRAHKEIPQDINSFVNARIGAMLALGPIVRFVVESVGGEGTPPQVYDVEADANGQHLVLLVDEAAQRAYMIGGVLRAKSR